MGMVMSNKAELRKLSQFQAQGQDMLCSGFNSQTGIVGFFI